MNKYMRGRAGLDAILLVRLTKPKGLVNVNLKFEGNESDRRQ